MLASPSHGQVGGHNSLGGCHKTEGGQGQVYEAQRRRCRQGDEREALEKKHVQEHLGGAGVQPGEPPHTEAEQGGHHPIVRHHVSQSSRAGVKLLLQHQRKVAPEEENGEPGQELDEEEVPKVRQVHGSERPEEIWGAEGELLTG